MIRHLKRARLTALALVALVGLAACGNDPDAGFGYKMLSGLVEQKLGKSGQGTAQPLVLTRANLDGATTPIMLARIEGNGTTALLGPVATNHDTRTWSSADGATLSLTGGFLVATRGLGGDMLSADTKPLAAALSAGGGSYARVYEHLDGENQVVETSLSCQLTAQGTQVIEVVEKRYSTQFYQEVCTSGSGTATNQYWVEPGTGLVRQSRQWVSPSIGMLFLQQVAD